MKPLNKEYRISNKDLHDLREIHNKNMETENMKELVNWLNSIEASYQVDLLLIKINNVTSLVFRKSFVKLVVNSHAECFNYNDNWEFIFSDNELFIKIK